MYKKILLIILAFTVDHAMACKNIELNNLKCTDNYNGEINSYKVDKVIFTENSLIITIGNSSITENFPSDTIDEDGFRSQSVCINGNLVNTDTFSGVSATKTITIDEKGLSFSGEVLDDPICDETDCTISGTVNYSGSCTL